VASKSQYRFGEEYAVVSELLDSVEHLLERTKFLYEQYFMGVEEMPPSQLHRDVERQIRDLTRIQIGNTALGYRLTMVTQKFGVYDSYWRRTMKQVDQGTYVRDVTRVSRAARERGEAVPDQLFLAMPERTREAILGDPELLARCTAEGSGPAEMLAELAAKTAWPAAPNARSAGDEVDASVFDGDLDMDIDELFRALTSETGDAADARPAAPCMPGRATPPPIPARPTPPPISARGSSPVVRSQQQAAQVGVLPPGMTEAKTRDLYRRYLQARRLMGESTDVPYEQVVQSLRSEAPRIMQRHKARAVEFDVVIRNDKVLLKAKPRL
jgi:hypothetical protein